MQNKTAIFSKKDSGFVYETNTTVNQKQVDIIPILNNHGFSRHVTTPN